MSEYAAPIGAPIWFDLMSSDSARAAEFYHQIFGWEVEAPPQAEFGGYQNFTRNGKRVAGLVPQMAEAGPANIWSVYLHTSDGNATIAAAEAAGATVMVPPMAVGDLGSMMVVVDPAGAVIGFWQPGTHVGFSEWGEHGTPYWFECQSKDYDASLAFYRAVLGARIEEIGTGGDPDAVGPDRYGQVFVGESAYSGIMDAAKLFPADVPSFWQVYITVDDVAATVKKERGSWRGDPDARRGDTVRHLGGDQGSARRADLPRPSAGRHALRPKHQRTGTLSELSRSAVCR